MMEKTVTYVVFYAVLLWEIKAVSKFCRLSSDCDDRKRCCERLCLSRKACNGLCFSDVDCDKDYGESCTLGKCRCVHAPCRLEKNTRQECVDESQCYTNETCIDGVCQNLNSINNRAKSMSPAVLGIVATVGLIIFGGAFYLCLKNQHSSRPSLAAKQSHHHAVERARMSAHRLAQTHTVNGKESREPPQKDDKSSWKKHCNTKESQKKLAIASPCSLIELSAIIEEEEISEIAS